MKILVCCKVVLNEEFIEVKNDQLVLDNVPTKISQYDLNALEVAKQFKKDHQAQVTVLTVGPSQFLNESKIRKDILSRGADDLIVINNDSEKLNNSLEVAKILKSEIQKIENYDLILTGTGSSDLYIQATGLQLGTLLDIPTLNNVTNIEVDGDNLKVERNLENSTEIFELAMPCLLSVSSEINSPSVPAMKDIMQAGKKPVNESSQESSDKEYVNVISEVAPPQADRQQNVFEEVDDEAIDKLVSYIKAEAL